MGKQFAIYICPDVFEPCSDHANVMIFQIAWKSSSSIVYGGQYEHKSCEKSKQVAVMLSHLHLIV